KQYNPDPLGAIHRHPFRRCKLVAVCSALNFDLNYSFQPWLSSCAEGRSLPRGLYGIAYAI
ncbi:MAG: hypothetical protein ACI9QQ_001690, partial [Myxococcota bacterium]